MQLAEGKSEVLGEFYAKTPMVPAFPSPEGASEWLRPALIGAVAPSILRAPRRGLGFSIGGSFYLASIAFLAAATVGVFFGIAFFLVRQSADAMVSVHPVGARVSDAATPPQHDLPRGAAAALGASNVTTAMARTAVPARSDVAPALPDPAQKALASEPTKAAAQIPAALRLADRQLAELLARGDEFLRSGDIASARLFYERAADAGDGQAALRMGATFDPTFLASAGLRNLRGDPAKARLWYHRALGLGASEAQPHLNNLETK